MLQNAVSDQVLHCLQIVQPFYTPPHNSGMVLWFHVFGRLCVSLSIRPSVVHPSVFRFRMI